MKNKFILGLSLLALAGATHAEVTAKSYDFNSIVLNGSGATAGATVSLTVNGTPKGNATVASDGKYKFSVTGLDAGYLYKCVVSNGDTCEVVLGNGTGKLFGADADGNPEFLGGSWNTTDYPTPDRTTHPGFYTLAGTSNRFDVTVSTGNIVYIDSEMTFSDGADELEPFAALGAFTLAQTNETDDADFFWAGLVKKDGNPAWVALTAQGVDAAAGSYTSRMEFDFNSTPAKVRYWVKSMSGSESAFVVLRDGLTEWFNVANAEAEKVSSVSFEGTGSLASFEGSSLDANVAEVDSTKYATIADALTNNIGGTVALLTNTKPAANAALSGNNWTITANGNSFEPYETTGYTFTYEGTAFAVMPYQTSVNVTGTTTMGYDFTNGTVNVEITGSHIQSGTSVSATVTVKNAEGTQIASQTFSDITGNTNLELKVADLNVGETYTYEVDIKKGDEQIAKKSDAFAAAQEDGWFFAHKDHWAQDGSWKKNDEVVTVSGEKIELGGNQYDFTPTAPDISNVIVRVDTVIELNGAIDSEDLPTGGDVQGMIALVETDGATPTTAWQAYVGGSWVSLTGDNVSTEPGTYTIRAEFDYRGSGKTVRYSVAPANGSFVILKNGATEWIANGVQSATTLAGTSARGAGNLVSLKGDNIDASVAEVDGVRYETMAAALAAAAGKDVKLLWNCTWTPGLNGQWIVNVNDKNLVVYGADGWRAVLDGNVLKASNVEVAQVGTTKYFFLDEAFAVVAENGTVEMLTNLVQSVNVAVEDNAILDLAGWFVSGDGKLNVADTKTLVFTNSTAAVGGFGMAGVADAGARYSICGGKWVDNDNTETLGTNYKFIKLAEEPTVDGVTYKYEAMFTTIDPSTPAKVYPVKDGNNSVGDAVVTDAFVSQYLPDITDPVEIATMLNQPPADGNGLPLIQSYILNLMPTDPTSKPVVGAVQNAEATQVTLSLGALTVNTTAGVPVQFSLSTSTSPDFTGVMPGEKQATSKFNVGIGSDKLQYYKINIHFGK